MNPPVTGGFPSQRPVTRSFDVFFDLRLTKRSSKQSRRRWFETPSRSLWRHCKAVVSATNDHFLYRRYQDLNSISIALHSYATQIVNDRQYFYPRISTAMFCLWIRCEYTHYQPQLETHPSGRRFLKHSSCLLQRANVTRLLVIKTLLISPHGEILKSQTSLAIKFYQNPLSIKRSTAVKRIFHVLTTFEQDILSL